MIASRSAAILVSSERVLRKVDVAGPLEHEPEQERPTATPGSSRPLRI